MGNNLRDLRRRIRSVKSTQQITRAMKLVATSKLRRAQEDMQRFRPFAAGMRSVVASLVSQIEDEAHPLLQRRESGKVLLVVVTGDRGLAGSFNANVQRDAMKWLEANSGRELALELVGRKSRDFFRRRKWSVRGSHVDVFRRVDYEASRALAQTLVKAFLEEDFAEVWIMSNRFRTVMSQDLTLERLLPVGRPEAPPAGEAAPAVDYIYEPDPVTLLGQIIPLSVDVAVHQALLESNAAENGARMVAMENATKNAGEMIERLTLQLNRSRQAAITTEIIEIVSGAAALGA